MWFGCPQPDAVVSPAYRCVLAFLYLRQPLSLLRLGLWVVWCNSGEVMVKEQGREIRIDRIQICVRIIDVWW